MWRGCKKLLQIHLQAWWYPKVKKKASQHSQLLKQYPCTNCTLYNLVGTFERREKSFPFLIHNFIFVSLFLDQTSQNWFAFEEGEGTEGEKMNWLNNNFSYLSDGMGILTDSFNIVVQTVCFGLIFFTNKVPYIYICTR